MSKLSKILILSVILMSQLVIILAGFSISRKSHPAREVTISEAPKTIDLPIAFSPLREPKAQLEKKEASVLQLGARNTLVFRGVVTGESVAKIQVELLRMSQELPHSATIYLVLDTPGGSIQAGNQLIDMAKALPQEVKTLTIFSASMGFHTAQNLGERLVLPNGTMMSHRAKGGVEGEVPGSAVVRLNDFLRLVNVMDSVCAKRMGLSLDKYQFLVRDEYWVTGQDAVEAHAADRVVLARCGSDLMGSTPMTVATMFGTLKVTYSDCPLISAPLSVDLSALKFTSPQQQVEFLNFWKQLNYEKEQFVREQIVTNKFERYLK